MLGIQNEREWVAFCDKVLGQPDLARDPRYDSNTKRTTARMEVVSLIEKVFSKMSAAQVIQKLDTAGIANARMNTPEEVWNHPQLQARNRWREVGSPVGMIPAPLPPATFAGTDARMDPIPAVGEHTDRILAELGYPPGEIDALRAASAI
jgi:crotonobetainyl-CoA:carnitine CoA-transferase CaiB-like acyl-CoA transferase